MYIIDELAKAVFLHFLKVVLQHSRKVSGIGLVDVAGPVSVVTYLVKNVICEQPYIPVLSDPVCRLQVYKSISVNVERFLIWNNSLVGYCAGTPVVDRTLPCVIGSPAKAKVFKGSCFKSIINVSVKSMFWGVQRCRIVNV